jgi:iron complex outermembrane receptor protein
MTHPLPAWALLPFRPRNDVAAWFIGAALAAFHGAGFAQNTPATEPTAEGQLERITISAEKRLTLLDATPAAVTALSGIKLAEQGLTTFSDVVTQVPNTSFTTGQGASQLFIRGIGNVFILAGGDPGVALYADGAYVSDQTSSNVSLFDLQRVEVLRGPQGALYGRNATGGAMNLISARPTSTFQARAGVLLGNYNRKESEGFISGPAFGEASGTRMRLSYQVKSMDGTTDNPLAGTSNPPVISGATRTAPDHLDDLSSRALRLQSLSDLGPGTLHLQAGHFYERDAGPSMPLLVDPVMIPGLLFGVSPSTDPRVVKSQGASNFIEVNSLLAGWEQQVGDATLNITASFRKSHADRLWDSDTTEAAVATSGFRTRSEDTSLDAHLGGESGALTWLAGISLLQFDQRQDIDIQTLLPLPNPTPPPAFLPFPVEFMLGGQVRTTSASLYTDLRYALTPQWALLAGLRVNRDEKKADEYLNVAALGLAGTDSPRDSWTSVPGSLGVEYQIDKGSLVYARYAHGFKSGAVNLGSLQGEMVKPENVDSIELGYKTDFWARRGSLGVALFSSRYQDMQVSQVGQATVILANASKAQIDGAEIELQLRPVPSLTLGLSLGLMDPRYTDFENTDLRNAPTTPVNVKGNQLAQVSKSNIAANAEYSATVGGLKTTLRVDYVWRDTVYFTEFNTPDAKQDAYGLLNLSASLRSAERGWALYGYVKNATNETAITSMSIASPLLGAARQVTYTPPREFGIGVSFDF